MAKCTNCGTELEDGQKFCFECGTPVPQTKKCIKCGIELPLKMKFCPECGANQNGTTAAGGDGSFNLGDKNVIGGDVIGHKEETHVAGNATFIKNEDQTKQVKKCHICGSLVPIVQGFDCPECHQFTCKNCFNVNDNLCNECVEQKKEGKLNRYKDALKMVLADGRIEFSERKELISLQQELGISAEQARTLEEELKKSALGTSSEITTFEKMSVDKATELFYKEGNIKEALQLLEPVYQAHKHEEKVLDIYLPVLAEVAPLEALDIIDGLEIDILTAFVTFVLINLKQKKYVEAEKKLLQALRIWHDSSLVKCYQVLYNYAMYKQFNEFSFMEKACNLAEQLGEAQNELELSYQVKVQAMLQEEVGDAVTDFDKDFCEQNHLYWQIMNTNFSKNSDSSGITVGKDGKCDFKTIQEALNSADENAIIHIKPGIYNEHLVFKKQVHLMGCEESIENKSSNELPIIILDSSKTCEIKIPIEIEGIVFTHNKRFLSPDIRKSARFDKLIDLIQNSVIFGNGKTEESGSLLSVSCNCKFHNMAILYAASTGITFLKDTAALESVIIYQCPLGCKISKETSPIIQNSKIYHNKKGISAVDNSKPILSNCSITSNGGCIEIGKNSSGKYEDCYITDNSFGIDISDNASPVFSNCEIANNKGFMAFDIEGRANPLISNCSIKYNYGGIRCADASSPKISDCDIADTAKEEWLYICDCANPSITNCTIHGNEKGILNVSENSIDISSCKFWDNNYE